MYISKILFFLFCIYAPKISTSSIQVETQIGSFNLRTDKITEKKFINEYGKGFVVVDQNSVPKHIFYDDIQKLWISINFSHVLDEKKNSYVESILITSDSLCCKKFEPIKSFDPMLTSKGIKIGDTLLKIIAAYGEPSINIDIANESFFSFLRIIFPFPFLFKYASGRISSTCFFIDSNSKSPIRNNVILSGV